MRHIKSIDAVRLVWPALGWYGARNLRSPDGRATLKRRAFIRAVSVLARPINAVALGVALFILFAGESTSAVPHLVSFGLFAIVLQKGAAAPKRRRQARILRDVRPKLLNSEVQIPAMKRAGRIIASQPHIVIPDLPPDRPRSRNRRAAARP